LHLHVDCVDRTVAAALRRTDIPPGAAWSAHTIVLKGETYWIRWLAADQLKSTNPFPLLARSFRNARHEMGAWTIALVGAVSPGGKPGFYLLANRANPAAGDEGSSEDLQDHSCRL
jgi:CDP-diacylglycerol pyrophosphatase